MTDPNSFITNVPDMPLQEEVPNILLDGFLLRPKSNGTVRLGFEEIVMDIAIDDVVDIAERDLPPQLIKKIAIPVTIELKTGFRVRNLEPSQLFREGYYEPLRSFAAQTRKVFSITSSTVKFKKLEREFLKQHGVTWLTD